MLTGCQLAKLTEKQLQMEGSNNEESIKQCILDYGYYLFIDNNHNIKGLLIGQLHTSVYGRKLLKQLRKFLLASNTLLLFL